VEAARTGAVLTACAAGAIARPTAARPATTGSVAVGRPFRKTFMTGINCSFRARQDLARKAHQVVRTGPIEGDIRFSAALSASPRTGQLHAASDGDPAEAAAGAVRLALLPDDVPSGDFFSWDGTQVPW